MDLVVPLKIALEALANEPDAGPSIPGPEGDMDTVDQENQKEKSMDANPAEAKTITKTPVDSKEQTNKEEAVEAGGTLECPINVDDNDSDSEWEEEEFPSGNRRIIELAKYLPGGFF